MSASEKVDDDIVNQNNQNVGKAMDASVCSKNNEISNQYDDQIEKVDNKNVNIQNMAIGVAMVGQNTSKKC